MWGEIRVDHSDYISSFRSIDGSLSKFVGIIRKSSFYLFTKTLRTLYFSLLYLYFFTFFLFGPLLTELTLFVLVMCTELMSANLVVQLKTSRHHPNISLS